jgi:putative ubiquitin-RnfH superfamily antitoxin RatB of RatAB toxin-antitoxin module
MGGADEPLIAVPTLHVAVACSPRAGTAVEIGVELRAPATAWDAVCASGVLDRWPELRAAEPDVGIWGRPAARDHVLRDGDRVELYRSLTMLPGDARRLRARRGTSRR